MWPNPQETADLVAFTEKIHNEKDVKSDDSISYNMVGTKEV